MTTNPTTEETRMDDTDAPTVCITHGRFIPCRRDGRHHYSDNPFWVKCVRDFQSSPIEGLTWEDATPVETIADRAAIRDSDEPSERGDFPCCSGARVPLDLDAIEARANAVPDGWNKWADWQHYQILGLVTPTQIDGWAHPEKRADAIERTEAAVEHITGMDPATTLALVAEVRSLRAKVAAVEAKRDEFADLLARALPAVAALARVEALGDNNPDHADTCGSMLTPDAGYPCSCWQADLRAALATGEGK